MQRTAAYGLLLAALFAWMYQQGGGKLPLPTPDGGSVVRPIVPEEVKAALAPLDAIAKEDRKYARVVGQFYAAFGDYVAAGGCETAAECRAVNEEAGKAFAKRFGLASKPAIGAAVNAALAIAAGNQADALSGDRRDAVAAVYRRAAWELGAK